MKKGFTLVEIMIVVAILGLLVAIGVPGFLTARNKSQLGVEKANLKAISDNIASYQVNEPADQMSAITDLWPTDTTTVDPSSYIRKQLSCPISRVSYSVTALTGLGSCTAHGSENTVDSIF